MFISNTNLIMGILHSYYQVRTRREELEAITKDICHSLRDFAVVNLCIKSQTELFDNFRDLFSLAFFQEQPHIADIYQFIIHNQESVLNEFYRHLKACIRNGASYIPICDSNYPESLKGIAVPPIAITVLGNQKLLSTPSIAIVGSRKALPDTLWACRCVATALCKNYTIVSGGAFGCDIAAHDAVLQTAQKPCPAVIVMAGGLNYLYPQQNRSKFMQVISQGGAIVSEHLWFKKPRPYDFPIRNRIITALAETLMVMQADVVSGAMQSALHAMDQNKAIMVYYPKDDMAGFEGSLDLIKSSNAERFYLEDLCKKSGN